MIARGLRGVGRVVERSKVLSDNSVGYNGHHERIKRGAEDSILFARQVREESEDILRDPPCMTDADDMIYVAQNKLQQLVCQDACSIGEAKE